MRGGGTWNNASRIIGIGQFGMNESNIVNSGTITASGGTLDIDPAASGGLANSAYLVADATGNLRFNGNGGGGITNTGTLLASGGVITFLNSFGVSGGTLTTSAGGSISIGGSSSVSAFSNTGNIVVPNNETAFIGGAVNNVGSINVASTANFTDLYVAGVTLSGGGSLNMTNSARVRGGGTLTNTNNTSRPLSSTDAVICSVAAAVDWMLSETLREVDAAVSDKIRVVSAASLIVLADDSISVEAEASELTSSPIIASNRPVMPARVSARRIFAEASWFAEISAAFLAIRASLNT